MCIYVAGCCFSRSFSRILFQHAIIIFLYLVFQQEYSRLRVQSYKESDVIILCFSAIDRQSFERIRNLWIPEIQRTIKKKVPVFLVATHKDLKQEKYVRKCTSVVSKTEGEKLAMDINADGFFETSSGDSCCVKKIFECAVTAVHSSRKRYLQTLRKMIFK